MIRHRKWLLRGLLSILTLLVLAALAAYLFPQQVLCIDSGAARADVIVVLGGGGYERPQRAAELFLAGDAPLLIVTGQGDSETNRRLLTKKGVPADSIRLEPNARTTRENALLTLPLLRQAGARKVILVTSWYHSRRALRCFQHYGSDIQFLSRPSYYAFPRNQWTREGLARHIRSEYLKLAGYCLRYGISPL